MTTQPEDFSTYVARATQLIEQFFHKAEDDTVPIAEAIDDLDGAIDAVYSALDMAPWEDHREVAEELCYLWLTRYDLSEADADRDKAIAVLRLVCDDDAAPDLLIRLAELLGCRGEDSGDPNDFTDAIGYADHFLRLVPRDVPDREFALFIAGMSHLLRADNEPSGAAADRHAAVVHLGQARALLAGDDPQYGEVTAWYGIALATRLATLAESFHLSNALRKRAAEAIDVLSDCEARLRDDDPLRLSVRYAVAQTRALRYIAIDGPADDRRVALSELVQISELPDCDQAMSARCHFFCAMLLATHQVDDGFRRMVTRYGAATHRLFMESLTTHSGPKPEDARLALDHLDLVQAPDVASLVTVCDVLDLRAFAILHRRDGGASDDDLRLALALTEQAAGLACDDDPGNGMRDALAGFIRTELANRQGCPEVGELIVSLMTAADKLAPGSRLQPMLLGLLGEFAGRHSAGPDPSREASDAAAELVERALRYLPADHPARVVVLTRLGEIMIANLLSGYSAGRLNRIRALMDEAIAQPSAGDANRAVNHYLLGVVDWIAAFRGGDSGRFGAAVEQFRRAAELIPDQHQLRFKILATLSVLLRTRYQRDKNLEWLDASDHYATAALAARHESGAPPDDMAILLEGQLATAQVAWQFGQLRYPDAQVLDTAIQQLEEVAARLPADGDMWHALQGNIAMLRAGSSFELGVGPPGTQLRRSMAATAEAMTTSLSHRTRREHEMIGGLGFALAGHAKVVDGFARHNRRLLNEGLGMLFAACDTATAAAPDGRWQEDLPAALHMLSNGLRMRYLMTGDRADLSNAIVRLEDAHRITRDGQIGTLRALISYGLAQAYRERDDPQLGDRRRAAETGLRTLRDFVREVLLQSTADRALAAAQIAADRASDIVRWCLDADQPEAAVEALELGRGMVLHTATTHASVPALLREAGRPDLAAEWESAAHGAPAPWDDIDGLTALEGLSNSRLPIDLPLPSDLRQRVMTAIENTETERSLLSPPGASEIAATLRAADVDILAYLLPGGDGMDGLAVLVGVDGQVRDIPLPRLTAGTGSRLDTFADAQREWLRAQRAGDEAAVRPARRRWRGALNSICAWAWDAAMGQLLGAIPANPGRPARLVLVPAGTLGLVPWHAARRTAGHGARQYACQDAIISYAASARQYVTARRKTPRPWQAEPALIAVDGTQYWTPREIIRIHRYLYPDGLLLAGPEATARNVRDLLPGPGSPGASLLHVGTHAEPAEDPLDSVLRLQGTESLSTSDLLRQARGRAADASGGLVVLAACGTDLTGRDHDEALTLASALLALGAIGVIGTRWLVEDVPTAVFMTVFHQHLNSGYDDPAAALRATQLWMLDPHRVAPDSVAPALAQQMRTVDLDAVDAWAAYTYLGR